MLKIVDKDGIFSSKIKKTKKYAKLNITQSISIF